MEIKQLLIISKEHNASDLIISPLTPPIMRINGDLIAMQDIPILDAEETKNLICSIMNPAQQKLFNKILEIDFSVSYPTISTFRVNAFHQSRGIAAAFRIIPEEIPSLKQLGYAPIFEKLLNLSSGLILVTGP